MRKYRWKAEAKSAREVLATRANERHPKLARDSRWIAYLNEEQQLHVIFNWFDELHRLVPLPDS